MATYNIQELLDFNRMMPKLSASRITAKVRLLWACSKIERHIGLARKSGMKQLHSTRKLPPVTLQGRIPSGRVIQPADNNYLYTLLLSPWWR